MRKDNLLHLFAGTRFETDFPLIHSGIYFAYVTVQISYQQIRDIYLL